MVIEEAEGVHSYLLEVWDAVLGAEEGATCVDPVHEVVPLHVERLGTRQIDGARVVHQNVDSAKLFNSLSYGLFDALYLVSAWSAIWSQQTSSERMSHLTANALPPAFSMSVNKTIK